VLTFAHFAYGKTHCGAQLFQVLAHFVYGNAALL